MLVTNVDSSYKNTFNEIQVDRRIEPVSTDEYFSMALKYLFRKGTAEVKEFNSAEIIQRQMIEKDGILWNKNRTAAGLECTHISEHDINLGSLGVKFHAPCLDRYSPLSR